MLPPTPPGQRLQNDYICKILCPLRKRLPLPDYSPAHAIKARSKGGFQKKLTLAAAPLAGRPPAASGLGYDATPLPVDRAAAGREPAHTP